MTRIICFLAKFGFVAFLWFVHVGLAHGRSAVVLSEFMSSNSGGLADEDGEFPDWVELHNITTTNVNLAGWSLTDDPGNLRKWLFPATVLPADGYLIVFASDKDRHTAGAPLHTNFKLDASGEYLALIEADGVTVATAYDPAYPLQAPDVSFGLDPGVRHLTLLSSNAVGRVFIPTNDVLGTDWTLPAFDDSSWRTGRSAFGFSASSISTIPLPGLTNGLAGYWKFDETNGSSAVDSSGRGNTGILVSFPAGGLQWVRGINGNSLRFRGAPTTDLVRVNTYPKATNALSVAAWVWADGRPLWASIAKNWGASAGQFHFGLRESAGDLDIFIHTSAGDFSAREGTPLPLGSWQHVAFSATNGVLRLFRNGVEVATTPYTGNFVTPPMANLGIGVKLLSSGAADPSAPGFWQGQIDDLGIWNRALDPGEIEALARAGSTWTASLATDLRVAMFGQNASCYLRLPFTVENPDTVARWLFNVRYDDGFVAWLNGTEIVRRSAPETLSWDSAAMVARPDEEAGGFEPLNLAGFSDQFVAGTNVLAVQALNVSREDPDLLFQPVLEATSVTETTDDPVYFTTPTPGSANVVGQRVLGPIIKELTHQPAVPLDQEDVLVTARVAPSFALVTNVTLRYRIQFSNEVSVLMLDDGAHGDAAAGDGVYAASIPAAASNPGQMLRYAVIAADALGRTNREPLFADPIGSPQYRGTVIRNLSITSSLPVIQWFVANVSAAETDLGTRASFFTHHQEFHDNAYIRIRGGTARGWPKKSYKVELNEGDHFLIHPGLRRVSEFDLNATYTDKSYVRAALTAEHSLAAGVPAPETFHVQLRQNGLFYSVALFVEQPDRDFLRRHGLDPNGALYKCNPGSAFESVEALEKKTRKTENKSDAQALVTALGLTGANLETFVFDNLDVPALVNFLATIAIVQNIDNSDKNLFLYRDTEGTREWRLLPWDLDLTFGPDALNTDTIVTSMQSLSTPACASHPFIGARPYLLHAAKYNRLIEAIVNTPRTRQMLLRRIRSLSDQFLATSYFQDRIEQFYPYLTPDVQADRARWGVNAHFTGTTYSFRAALDRIKFEYLIPRLPYLTGTTIVGVLGANPGRQPFNSVVRLGPVESNPASANQADEFVCITNASPFPLDISGWTIRDGIEFTFKPGTVLPSNEVIYVTPNVPAFRARTSGPRGGQKLFVQGNYQGQLSARGERLRLLDAAGREMDSLRYPGSPSLLQQYLRITEIMYHPAPGPGGSSQQEDFEYVELRNLSPDRTLDLSGVRFSNGIEFSFTGSSVTTLAPGARVLVVRNLAAFASRYSALPPLLVAGEYLGALDNAGERIQLVDAAGEEILDFSYERDWHPITDGLGFSLVVIDDSAAPDDWNNASSWRESGQGQGSPGRDETQTTAVPRVVISEALTHTDQPPPTDSVELYNPEAVPASIGGWFLSDDFNTPRKFRITAGTVLDPGAYRVFTEADFNPTPGVPPSFSLGADGDEAWLFSADASGQLTGYFHGFRFGAAEDGVSFARQVTSDGREQFVPQTTRTLGTANSAPRVGPVVFSEILYHPAAFGTNDPSLAEFLELHNPGAETVLLYDPAAPTNTWRITGGIDFMFPPGAQLAAGGCVLVANFDPTTDTNALARFRARYQVDPAVPVFGPYEGGLSDDDDELELERPILLGNVEPAFVLVDQVHYRDAAPWPETADGFGLSLQRRILSGYGNEPAHWIAASPNAGVASAVEGRSPSILQQPSNQDYVAFGSAFLSVVADGSSPLRYQWRANGVDLPGATNALLWLAHLQPAQAGTYQVVVHNQAGSVLSSNISLTLRFPPVLVRDPSSVALRGSTNAANYGTTSSGAVFNVSAYSLRPISYQWRRDGVPIPGATGPTLTVNDVTLADEGWYDVVLTDDVGSVTSTPARLTVVLTPLVVLPPTDQAVVQGGSFTASLTIKGNPPPFHYLWRHSTSNVSVSASSSTTSFFTRSNVQINQGGAYRVSITNAFTNTVVTALFTVTVLADQDGDGLPDAWEQSFFGEPTASDRNADSDGDGSLNGQEYVAGTDPTDPLSFLRIDSFVGADRVLTFNAISNRTYAIDYNDDLGNQPWLRLTDIAARKTNRTVEVTDPNPGPAQRLYRLLTPRAP